MIALKATCWNFFFLFSRINGFSNNIDFNMKVMNRSLLTDLPLCFQIAFFLILPPSFDIEFIISVVHFVTSSE